MPAAPTPTQPDASRPTGPAATAPPTPTATRHGLCGRTFYLLPDESEAEWRQHESLLLASLAPRDALEHEAALAAIRAMWREMRADRLEAQVLTDLFAAGRLEDPDEATAAKAAALKALGTMLRYRGRIEREQRQAMQALDALRQRQLRRAPAPPTASVPSEPEPPATVAERAPCLGEPADSLRLNRHQRRAQKASERRGRPLAA